MEKIIKFYDYSGKSTKIKIENFENVEAIACAVLTGDEILQIRYKNGDVKQYDSCDDRFSTYFDGFVIVPLSEVDKFSEMADSYEMLAHFSKGLWE